MEAQDTENGSATSAVVTELFGTEGDELCATDTLQYMSCCSLKKFSSVCCLHRDLADCVCVSQKEAARIPNLAPGPDPGGAGTYYASVGISDVSKRGFARA